MLDQFYRALLPGTGYYALFDAPRKAHIWAESIEDLTRKTEERIDQQGLYFATCSFQEPTSREAYNALFRRALCIDIDAGEEKYAKHGDKVYKTQRDALLDLMRWIEESGVKPSMVVSSGEGLHVYLRLTAEARTDEWLPAARGLKGMALAMGLRIDAAVTADVVRVLRPVATLHKNGSRVRILNHNPIEHDLAVLAERVALYMPRVKPKESSLNAALIGTVQGPPKSAEKVARNCAAFAHAVNLRGDVEEPYWRAMLGIFKFCENGEEQAHAASEGHPDYDYDETQGKLDRWNVGPTTCDHFSTHNAAACNGCKFRGKVTSPIQLGELNDKELVSEGRTPLAAQPAPVPTDEPEEFSAFSDVETLPEPESREPWKGCIPPGFAIHKTANGYSVTAEVIRMVEDETAPPDDEGNRPKKSIKMNQQFAAVPFWFESWAAGKHDGDQALTTYCIYDQARQAASRYTMPTKHAAQRDALLGTLASQNVQVFPSNQQTKQLMEDFVKASLERMRVASQRQKITDRFGTNFDDKGNLVVAQGRHVIYANGSVSEAVVDEKLKGRAAAFRVPLPDTMSGVWDKKTVVKHVLPLAQAHIDYLREYYDHKNFVPYQLAIMLSWGSPMMAFMQGTFQPGAPLPNIGLTVSLYSTKSGIGKTAAVHAAALAFGVPTALAMQLDRQSSTDFARQAMVLQCGTMPSFMDEMEDVEPKDLASLISMVGNGVSRSRVDGKTMQVVGGAPLALINTMTTNKSHRELVAADRSESPAVQMRLLEIDCSNVEPVEMGRSAAETRARGEIQRCAGAVGTMIHLAMCQLGHEKLSKLGQEMAIEARNALVGKQDGRLMWRALGAMLAVRAILKSLGLEVFNTRDLVNEFRVWHDAGYSFSAERLMPSDPAVLASLMLTDLLPRSVLTRGESDKRLKDFKPDPILNDRLPHEIAARVVLDGRYAYVRTDAIREWAFNKRISYRTIIGGGIKLGFIAPSPLARTDNQSSMQFDLLKGTIYSTGARAPVVKILLDQLTEADLTYEKALGNNVVALNANVKAARTAEPQPGAADGE